MNCDPYRWPLCHRRSNYAFSMRPCLPKLNFLQSWEEWRQGQEFGHFQMRSLNVLAEARRAVLAVALADLCSVQWRLEGTSWRPSWNPSATLLAEKLALPVPSTFEQIQATGSQFGSPWQKGPESAECLHGTLQQHLVLPSANA